MRQRYFLWFLVSSSMWLPSSTLAQKPKQAKRKAASKKHKRQKLRYFAFGKHIIKGTGTQNQIKRALWPRHKIFRQLFFKHFAKRNPAAAGAVYLKWIMNGHGKVQAAIVMPPHSTLGKAFERDLARVFLRLRFGRPHPCGVTVIYTTMYFSMYGLYKNPAKQFHKQGKPQWNSKHSPKDIHCKNKLKVKTKAKKTSKKP